MGTVHKFKRPPKNRKQFEGYRPQPGGAGRYKPRRVRFWQKLRPWQRNLLAWTLLIVLAAGMVGVRRLLA